MPYYIAVYDANVRRVAKVLKLFRRYLTWLQRSVFEGELTEAQFYRLRYEVQKLINPDEDVVIFYELRDARYSQRVVLGTEQGHLNCFKVCLGQTSGRPSSSALHAVLPAKAPRPCKRAWFCLTTTYAIRNKALA